MNLNNLKVLDKIKQFIYHYVNSLRRLQIMKDKNYDEAIKKAKEMASDVKKRGQEALGDDALDFMDSLMSPDEILESDLRVQLIDELVRARNEQGISQKKLE